MERLTFSKEADTQRKAYQKRLDQGYPRNIPEERYLRLAAYEDTKCMPDDVRLFCETHDPQGSFMHIIEEQRQEISRLRAELEAFKKYRIEPHDLRDMKHDMALIAELRAENADTVKMLIATRAELKQYRAENAKLTDEVEQLGKYLTVGTINFIHERNDEIKQIRAELARERERVLVWHSPNEIPTLPDDGEVVECIVAVKGVRSGKEFVSCSEYRYGEWDISNAYTLLGWSEMPKWRGKEEGQ